LFRGDYRIKGHRHENSSLGSSPEKYVSVAVITVRLMFFVLFGDYIFAITFNARHMISFGARKM
jgi:hypothetical protein